MPHTTTVSLTDEQREQLRAARERAGLTQTEVGNAAGCTYNMVCQIESGAKSPSFGLLVAICGALSIEPRLSLVRAKK
jgi:transcriptional regulator with XRE-family HTH domain